MKILIALKVLFILLFLSISLHSLGDENLERDSSFEPLPLEHGLYPLEIELGEKLFHDPILSIDKSVSCSSCHSLDRGGVDGSQFSTGVEGYLGDINTPTVFNSSFNFKQFWDGRANSLEDQVSGPITNPREMGSNWDTIIKRLRKQKEYVRSFNNVYSDGINKNNIIKAIANFERSLITPNSKFDRYLRNEEDLSKEEEKGLVLFKSYGCVSCHQGQGIGGNMFQLLGIMNDYFADKSKIKHSDLGRYRVTGDERDMHMFKVPSLRNVELTAPYFHNGSVKTLEEAVLQMGYYQLGIELSQNEVDSIVAFLKTLTGQYKGEKLK